MLDMKFVRDNPEKVIEAVHNRNGELNLDEFLALDKERRELTQQVEVLKNERNTASKAIGQLKKAGENAEEKMAEVRTIGDKIAADDTRLREIEARLKEIMLSILTFRQRTAPLVKAMRTIRKYGSGANPANLTLSPCPTGRSAKSLIFLISNGAIKFPAPVLRCIKDWVPVWNGQSSTSIWICTPLNTATRNFSRPLS